MQRFWKHYWIKIKRVKRVKRTHTKKERHPNLKRPHIVCGLCVFYIFFNYFAACAVSTKTLKASGSFAASSANIFLFTWMFAFLSIFMNFE